MRKAFYFNIGDALIAEHGELMENEPKTYLAQQKLNGDYRVSWTEESVLGSINGWSDYTANEVSSALDNKYWVVIKS